MSRAESQHSFGELLLGQFAEGSDRDARVWVYERGKGQPWAEHPGKVMQEIDVYGFRLEGESRAHPIERLLGLIEANALSTLKRIADEDDFEPTADERQAVGLLVALQEFVVSDVRAMSVRGATAEIAGIAEFAAALVAGVDRYIAERPLRVGEAAITIDTFRSAILDHEAFQRRSDASFAIPQVFQVAPMLARYYASMRWVIHRVPVSEPLTTSDNPVIRRVMSGGRSTSRGRLAGPQNAPSELWIAVSRTTALAIGVDVEEEEARPRTLHSLLSAKAAADFKRLVASSAHRYVFSPVRDGKLSGMLMAPPWA